MKIINYTFAAAIVGFILGLLISICTVGCNDTLVGGCNCLNKYCEGCSDYFSYDGCIITSACGLVAGSTCAAVGCLDGCFSSEGCVSGCIAGFKEGYSNVDWQGSHSCGVCSEGCKECNDGCITDATDAYMNVVSNFKTKGYIVYLTIIGAFIGTVFGIIVLIQEKERKERDIQAEKERKERDIQAEKERKERDIQAAIKERQHESDKKWIKICKVLMPEEVKQLTEEQKNELSEKLKEQAQDLQKIFDEKEKKDEEFRRSLEEARKREEKANEIKQMRQRKKQKWYFIIKIILIVGGIIYLFLTK